MSIPSGLGALLGLLVLVVIVVLALIGQVAMLVDRPLLLAALLALLAVARLT